MGSFWRSMRTFENGDRLDILVTLVENTGNSVAHKIRPMPTDIARYSIELFKQGGEGAGIEEILDRHADLEIARSVYRTRVEEYPGRLIMLCDHVGAGPKRSARDHAAVAAAVNPRGGSLLFGGATSISSATRRGASGLSDQTVIKHGGMLE